MFTGKSKAVLDVAFGRKAEAMMRGASLAFSAACDRPRPFRRGRLRGSPPAAGAQGLDFADQKGRRSRSMPITALELSQDAKTLIARGNAKAMRGDVTVTADTLNAYYRDKRGARAPAKRKPQTQDAPRNKRRPAASQRRKARTAARARSGASRPTAMS